MCGQSSEYPASARNLIARCELRNFKLIGLSEQQACRNSDYRREVAGKIKMGASMK
jgi:hypothetical protein